MQFSKLILGATFATVFTISACTPGQNPLDSLADSVNDSAVEVLKSGCLTAVKDVKVDLGGITAESLCDCAAEKTKEKAKTDKTLLAKIAADKAEREKLTVELLEQCSKELAGKAIEGLTQNLFKS